MKTQKARLSGDALKKLAESRLIYSPQSGLFRWSNGPRKGQLAGSISDSGYRMIHLAGKNYRAHRLAHLIHYGCEPVEANASRWFSRSNGSESQFNSLLFSISGIISKMAIAQEILNKIFEEEAEDFSLPQWYKDIEHAISDLEEDGRFDDELPTIKAQFEAFAFSLLDALEELE